MPADLALIGLSRPMRRTNDETPERAAYEDMLARCYNPMHPEYPNEGGRGIKVCERWRCGENGKSGFECFLEDMGPMPKD